MAIEILTAISQTKPTVPREVHHDLESYLWVIIYTIYKHTCAANPTNRPLQTEFKRYFGGYDLMGIVASRYEMIVRQPELQKCIGRTLKLLVRASTRLILDQNPLIREVEKVEEDEQFQSMLAFPLVKPVERTAITYEYVFSMLGATLAFNRTHT
jgi:hypothetical protein